MVVKQRSPSRRLGRTLCIWLRDASAGPAAGMRVRLQLLDQQVLPILMAPPETAGKLLCQKRLPSACVRCMQVAYGHMLQEGEHILISQPIVRPARAPSPVPCLEVPHPLHAPCLSSRRGR